MRGALHVLPVFVSADDAAAAVAQVQREEVHPIPHQSPPVPKRIGATTTRLAAILASVQSDVVCVHVEMVCMLAVAVLVMTAQICACGAEGDRATPIDLAKLQTLPRWAQDVVRSGCFEGASSRPFNKRQLDQQSVFQQTRAHENGNQKHRQLRPSDVNDVRPKKRIRQQVEVSSRRDGGSDEDADHEDDEMDADENDEYRDGDDCPPRTLFKQEERVAESVEKYSDQLSQLLDVWHQRQQSETFQRDEADLLTRAEVKSLLQTLKITHKRGMIEKFSSDMLLELMVSLDKQVLRGIGLDILGAVQLNNGDEEWKASGISARLISRMRLCLDVGICELLIISSRDVDRRVLSEEAIDNCIQMFTHVVQRLIVPCIDSSAAAALVVPADEKECNPASADESNAASPRSKMKQKGRRVSAMLNIRANRDIRAAIAPLVNVACEFIEQLSKLVVSVKLADRWILHFSSSMSALFLLEHSLHAAALQRSAMAVLRGLFLQYEPHRSLILDEIVAVMKKLPTAKRHLRTVKLPDSSSSIQMVSTLVVTIVQASASIREVEKTNASTADAKGRARLPAEPSDTGLAAELNDYKLCLADTRQSAATFVRTLVKECLKKDEDRDYRVVLENFVEDMLMMFVRPEWPGAEVLLEIFSSSLASVLHSNVAKDGRKPESQHTLTALNFLGKICTVIKKYQTAAANDVIGDDADALFVLEEHASFLKENFQDPDCENEFPESTVILKHALMVFTRSDRRANTAHDDSRRLLLARFIADVSPTPELTPAQGIEVSLWRAFWKNSPQSVVSTSKLQHPSSGFAQRLSLQLAVTREFCCSFGKLLAHVMSLLSKGAPAFRARVLKILAAVVDVDPMLMMDVAVRAAVNRCFTDEGTSVRQAAVDLVGRHVALQPLLVRCICDFVEYCEDVAFDRYFDLLAERLRDKGISVRKSVCKIFRVVLTSLAHGGGANGMTSGEDLRRKSSCMRSLVERIGDPSEEQTLKNFIIDTFQEVWFGAELASRRLSSLVGDFAEDGTVGELPPGWKPVWSRSDTADGDFGTPHSKHAGFLSPDGKVVRSLADAWSAFRTPQVKPLSVVKSQQSKSDDTPELVITIVEVIHDMPNVDWFVSLLKRLLQEDDGEKIGGIGGVRAGKDRADDVSVAKSRSEKIIEHLVECLLQLEEGTPLEGVTIEDKQMQFLACMKTLAAFCEARPLLLQPRLELILIHLRGDDNLAKSVESKVQSLVLSMADHVFAHMERVPERLVKRLETDIQQLVFRAPPSVVGPSIKCLATLSKISRKPPLLLCRLLETFYSYLQKYRDLESLVSLSADTSSSVQRALFTAGQVGGAIDLDACAVPEGEMPSLKRGSVMESLYDTFARFVRMEGNPTCAAKAAQGLGFLFLTCTRLLLQAQQDGILGFLLADSADEMKLQCLTSLTELLRFEERRLEHGFAVQRMNKLKSKRQQVQGDQEADAALIGSVMQAQIDNILALSLDKSVRIRCEAVAAIDALLTQGLVSPMQCVPMLVALETDQVVSTRDVAHSQLVVLNEKFPTLLNTALLQGIRVSHSFQQRAFGASTVFTLDKDKREYCLFGRLYSECIRPGRKNRNLFLKALVHQLADSAAGVPSFEVAPSSPSSSLSLSVKNRVEYLCYVAQLLCALPYEVEDEPLQIIYWISRYITLKLSTALDAAKELFANAGFAPDIMADEGADFLDVDAVDHLPSVQLSDAGTRSLQEECVGGYAISLLIRAKFFLKDLYRLENEKCVTYQPSASASKATDEPVQSDRVPMLRLPNVFDRVASPDDAVALSWNLFVHTWEAARDEQRQAELEVQEDVSGKVRKRSTRRRKSLAAAKHDSGLDEDDEDFVEGFAG
ncbi:hypothetical protein PybrP1_011707 [[Pythium] brassicae (nom. inval.)]|nr:hypothetical protein PybrP1_011707 [[Pythium] brassicae (nom. inval.)]